MKTQILKHGKWWLITAILAVALMAVSLSFCAWDDYSLKSVAESGKTGNYAEKPDRLYEIVTDDGTTGVADVGDIVTFGEYYQEDAAKKTPLRWIVVDTSVGTDGKAKLTLLTEKVVAFGSFWGTYYYNSGNSWGQGTPNNGTYYQNYSQSTVRAWLNSGQRTDVQSDNVNAVFSATDSNHMFRGFLQEAFNPDQQAYILPKTISGMYGSKKDAGSHTVSSTYCEPYATVTDKVWLPSYSEVFGNSTIGWNGKSDGTPNTKFSYFVDNEKRKATTTAFARSSASNYTWKGATGAGNYQSVTTAAANIWWWLRSPNPTGYGHALLVDSSGADSNNGTDRSSGGVRPAVCVPL